MTEKIKDIFDFIKNPQKEEYRVECCIDKLYDINKYNGLTNFTGNKIEIKKFLINDAIMNYKKSIRDKIKANVSDKKIGEKVNSIYSRLQQEQYLELRDNIVHNKSDSFYKIEKDYSQTLDSLYGEKQIPIDELINRIDKICSIISEQIEIINDFFRMKLNRRKE